jgi:hypothetical protein
MEREHLSIGVFVGAEDRLCLESPIRKQIHEAMTLAHVEGYKNVFLGRLEGKGHERLAVEMLDHFSSWIIRR